MKTSENNWRSRSRHALSISVLVRSQKLSNIEPGQYPDERLSVNTGYYCNIIRGRKRWITDLRPLAVALLKRRRKQGGRESRWKIAWVPFGISSATLGDWEWSFGIASDTVGFWKVVPKRLVVQSSDGPTYNTNECTKNCEINVRS